LGWGRNVTVGHGNERTPSRNKGRGARINGWPKGREGGKDGLRAKEPKTFQGGVNIGQGASVLVGVGGGGSWSAESVNMDKEGKQIGLKEMFYRRMKGGRGGSAGKATRQKKITSKCPKRTGGDRTEEKGGWTKREGRVWKNTSERGAHRKLGEKWFRERGKSMGAPKKSRNTTGGLKGNHGADVAGALNNQLKDAEVWRGGRRAGLRRRNREKIGWRGDFREWGEKKKGIMQSMPGEGGI